MIATTLCASAHGETLTLDQAIQRALAFAPTVASANAQSDLSDALVREARAPLDPSLSAGSEYMQAPGYSKTITTAASPTRCSTSITPPMISAAARRWYARPSIRARPTAMACVPRRPKIFATTVAYYDLLQSQEIDRELDLNDARLRRYVTVIKALHNSGRSIANDVLKVQTASNNAGLSLSSAHHDVDHATAVLGSLIGQFNSSDIRVVDAGGLPAWPGDDLSRNPMLQAAQRTVASARAGVLAAERERYPTVRLALNAGWQGINPPRTFTPGRCVVRRAALDADF